MASAEPDSDDDVLELRKDEYGERFEDYGFLRRAEDHKQQGNTDFSKDRYEKALKEYECSLDQLLTVAHDKSIIIGKRKWNDVVVLRSTIQLNRSACHFKLGEWQKSADAALECLIGNVREEMMYTDPKIRAKVKEAEAKSGKLAESATTLEQKLPKATRAKAWFRLARCRTNLGHLDRAKEALAKALEVCEDTQTLAEMNQHALRLDTLEKREKQKQKQQFKGFFEKLQDRGGYVDAKTQTKAKWDTLDYAQKVKQIEELDDSDGDDWGPWNSDNRQQEEPGPEAASAATVAENKLEVTPGGVEEREAVQGPYAAADISALRSKDSKRREQEWRERTKKQEMMTEEEMMEEEELQKARKRLVAQQRRKRQQQQQLQASKDMRDSDVE